MSAGPFLVHEQLSTRDEIQCDAHNAMLMQLEATVSPDRGMVVSSAASVLILA